MWQHARAQPWRCGLTVVIGSENYTWSGSDDRTFRTQRMLEVHAYGK